MGNSTPNVLLRMQSEFVCDALDPFLWLMRPPVMIIRRDLISNAWNDGDPCPIRGVRFVTEVGLGGLLSCAMTLSRDEVCLR